MPENGSSLRRTRTRPAARFHAFDSSSGIPRPSRPPRTLFAESDSAQRDLRQPRTQLPALVRDTRPVNVELDNVAQSTPEKSASMVRDSALPTLSNVPTQPRGD